MVEKEKTSTVCRSPDGPLDLILAACEHALPELRFSLTGETCKLLRLRSPTDGGVLLERDLSETITLIEADVARPRAVAAHLGRFVDEVLEQIAPVSLDVDQPFPVLRTLEFITSYGPTALTRPGVGDCGAVLMRKLAHGTQSVITRARQDRDGLAEDALWAAARRNMRALSSTLVLQEYDYGVMSIEIDGQDWLGGSLLLAPNVMDQALERLGIQRALVCAPTEVSVDLVDADAPDATQRIERWMAERLQEARPQSEMVYQFSREDPRLAPRYASRGGRLLGTVPDGDA